MTLLPSEVSVSGSHSSSSLYPTSKSDYIFFVHKNIFVNLHLVVKIKDKRLSKLSAGIS